MGGCFFDEYAIKKGWRGNREEPAPRAYLLAYCSENLRMISSVFSSSATSASAMKIKLQAMV